MFDLLQAVSSGVWLREFQMQFPKLRGTQHRPRNDRALEVRTPTKVTPPIHRNSHIVLFRVSLLSTPAPHL